MSEKALGSEFSGKRIETISMDKDTSASIKLGINGPTLEVVPDAENEAGLSVIMDGITIPLHMGENTIGRIDSNDIVVNIPTVSREHASIFVGETSYKIHDNESLNGTLLA